MVVMATLEANRREPQVSAWGILVSLFSIYFFLFLAVEASVGWGDGCMRAEVVVTFLSLWYG
jgi:hypothetical protein